MYCLAKKNSEDLYYHIEQTLKICGPQGNMSLHWKGGSILKMSHCTEKEKVE